MARSTRESSAQPVSGSLFDESPIKVSAPHDLDVTFAKFLKHERLDGRSLFEGFETLRAVTYSTSAGFIRDLFGALQEIEVIFGSDVSIKGDLARLSAAQQAGVEAIKDEFGRAGKKLAEMLNENRLRLFYAHYTIHRKVFVLEGGGRRRVIIGSANMSSAAFGGLQSEHVVVFDDDPGMFQQALVNYEELLADCAPIPAEIFHKAGAVEIDQLPTFHKILHTREAFVVEPAKIGMPATTPSSSDPAAFVLKTEDYRRTFANALPPMIGKAVAITVDHIRKAREQQRQHSLIKGIESREIPRLELDPERREVRFRGSTLDLEPDDSQVASDAKLLDDFMHGYHSLFTGRVDELVQDYNAFIAWLLAAPFICLARGAALQHDDNVFRYPVCGVLYGKSNAGKTDLVKILMRFMFGHPWWLMPKDFTMTNFHGLCEKGGSFPIVVDDISTDKFREPAVQIIKNDFRAGVYPVLVLSTNQDVRAVQSEVIKRAVVVHAEASTPVAISSKNNPITRISKQITTALYRRYLARMLEEWPAFMSGFHGHDSGDLTHEAPDLVMLSSAVLRRTIGEALGEVPSWCAPVDVNLLGAMNGRKIKDRMRSQWQYKRNSFEIARNANRLIITVADQMDRNDFRKDLPSQMIDDVRQDKIIMWLDQAEKFFAIRFSSQSRLTGLVRRIFGEP
jgi:hypothetical protein